jgi:uncharacterized protein (DUF924 family)
MIGSGSSSAVKSFLTASLLTAKDFSAKPFIQQACKSPMSPSSVLSFFYGIDYHSSDYVDLMRKGTPLTTMQGVWYGGDKEYDQLCEPFGDVIKVVAGTPRALPPGGTTVDADWDGTVDGIMSQIILCDQLSRNCFRGTEDAFRYDVVSEQWVKRLVDNFFHLDNDGSIMGNKRQNDDVTGGATIPGELYPPYASFLITPLMHTEDRSNLQLAAHIIDLSLERFQDSIDPDAANSIQFQKGFLHDHRVVIDRFGRYPHRNTKLGRVTTPEEQVWLDDVENLPAWAKSQG